EDRCLLNGAPSFVTASVNPSPAAFGSTVTINTDAFPGTGPNPGPGSTSGSITLLINGVESVTKPVMAGAATSTETNLPAGSYTFELRYSGDETYAPTSATISETVKKDMTMTSLSATPSTTTFGTAVTLTAQVGYPGGMQPPMTGSVNFFDNG